jgi:hypothetical protein
MLVSVAQCGVPLEQGDHSLFETAVSLMVQGLLRELRVQEVEGLDADGTCTCAVRWVDKAQLLVLDGWPFTPSTLHASLDEICARGGNVPVGVALDWVE